MKASNKSHTSVTCVGQGSDDHGARAPTTGTAAADAAGAGDAARRLLPAGAGDAADAGDAARRLLPAGAGDADRRTIARDVPVRSSTDCFFLSVKTKVKTLRISAAAPPGGAGGAPLH